MASTAWPTVCYWKRRRWRSCKARFRVLPHFVTRKNYIYRIEPDCNTGLIPLAARNTTKFHRVYWTAFQEVCGAEFHSLSYDEQRTALTNFLLKKFSTDPEGKQMKPPAGKKRKTLSWQGFWLSDEEAKDIVETILQCYHTHRADLSP